MILYPSSLSPYPFACYGCPLCPLSRSQTSSRLFAPAASRQVEFRLCRFKESAQLENRDSSAAEKKAKSTAQLGSSASLPFGSQPRPKRASLFSPTVGKQSLSEEADPGALLFGLHLDRAQTAQPAIRLISVFRSALCSAQSGQLSATNGRFRISTASPPCMLHTVALQG